MVEINVDLALSLIEKQFPQWSHLPVKPVKYGGYDNFTFHLGEEMSIN